MSTQLAGTFNAHVDVHLHPETVEALAHGLDRGGDTTTVLSLSRDEGGDVQLAIDSTITDPKQLRIQLLIAAQALEGDTND